jgi:hypothetical protein
MSQRTKTTPIRYIIGDGVLFRLWRSAPEAALSAGTI